jgi:DNA-binding MurR/RpiR family transcriptional regulator
VASSPVLSLLDGHRLTPAQRRIARCLVEHADATYLSSGELADLAQVSQPSVTRFAMALGFDGYPSLRRRLRELAASGPSAQAEPDQQNELQRAVAAERDNLARLADSLTDPRPVAEAGALLAASRPLPVLGLRASAPLAAYFAYFAAKLHPDVRLLDEGGSLLADRLEQARAAGAGAMLAFVLPRYPREAVEALSLARSCGMSVVTVTDTAVSPVVAHSDLVLPAAVGSQLVFDLQAAPVALCTVLLQAMCDAMPAQAQQRLESFEQSAARRHVFVH